MGIMRGKVSSFVAFLVIMSFCHGLADAQNTQDDFVAPHNTSRAQVGVGAITWNTTVEAYAQNYANQRIVDCKLMHSDSTLYGENLFWGSGTSWNAANAVAAWVAEKPYYNHDTNTCATGHVCGHYTQVVWKNSVQLGCARVVCNNNAGVFIICNYYPPGNYVGQSPY